MSNDPKFIKYPEIVERICESIEKGVPISHAASASGISANTLDKWRRKGVEIINQIENGELLEENLNTIQTGFLNLYNRIEESQHKLLTENLVHIQSAGESHWQASAWILERRFPKYFSHTNRIKFDMSNAQTMLDLIIKDIVPFVPEERHNELAEKLDTLLTKLSVAIGDDDN